MTLADAWKRVAMQLHHAAVEAENMAFAIEKNSDEVWSIKDRFLAALGSCSTLLDVAEKLS